MKVATSLFLGAVLLVCVSSNTDFSVLNRQLSSNVYTEMLKKEQGNFLVCPISLEVIMALVQTGARGETAAQLARGMGLPEKKEEVEALMATVVPTLKGNKEYNLTSANKIFVKDGFKISDQFKRSAVQVFNSDIENVDFSQPPKAARLINQWVEDKTNNLIRDLISPDDLNELTRLVLVNALHFKGEWVTKFNEYGTHKRDFFITPENKVKIDMMSVTDNFKFYENKELDCKFLEMGYRGNDISMTFVLPNKKGNLRALENRIRDVFAPQPYVQERVNVQIPKFTMESTIKFKPILQQIGVKLPFTDDADFSGIGAEKEPLKIDTIIQKTFINVTEEGTEAAAATAGGFVTLSLPALPPPVRNNFEANHPFMIIIRRALLGDLFVGRVVKPTYSPYEFAKRRPW